MAVFVERADEARLEQAVSQALGADSNAANDPVELQRHVDAVKVAAAGSPTVHWGRVIVGVLIAGALIGAAIALALMADSFAADQAAKAASTEGYEAPESQLPEIAAGVMALATAWSGALVGALFAEATG